MAELLPQCGTIADIGTDHALLPIYIIEQKKAKRVIACDIAEGPLNTAKRNIESFGAADKILLRLAAGLDAVNEGECDAVSIAGMGGETIAAIIEAAPWLKTKRVPLVLQPMSCDDRLRLYLCQNGFEIEKESAVVSNHRVYTVMRVVFCQKPFEPSFVFLQTGKLLPPGSSDDLLFIKKRVSKLEKQYESIRGITGLEQKAGLIRAAIDEIKYKQKRM